MLAIVLVALGAAWAYEHKGDEVEVLSLKHAVPAGATLTRDDLAVERVSGVSSKVRLSELDSVLGKTTRVGLVRGELLSVEMVTSQPVPAKGSRLVAIQADSTRAPQDLSPGDVVEVLAAPPAGDPGTPADVDQPRTLAREAQVLRVVHASGGVVRLTLQVDQGSADAVALAAASNRVVVVQSPLGGDR